MSERLLPSELDTSMLLPEEGTTAVTGQLTFGTQRHWAASLALGFDAPAGKTRMHKMDFYGPLRVQRPFYPEGDVCHVYLLHPPGGLVSGDDLSIQIECGDNAHALLTTPSAGKIYHADSCDVIQKQQVNLCIDNARCEWLPMETLVFDGAHGVLDTCINLHGNAKFIGMDVICLGRPASDLPFSQGKIEQRLSLYHDGRPLLLERQKLAGNDPLMLAMPAFQGATVSGTLVAYGTDARETLVEQLRAALPEREGSDWFSVTERLDLIIVRYLGHDSEQAQRGLRLAWQILRPEVIGLPPCPPRIWAT
ncbi:urease accessory protein UreD [Corallincola spongiicola]|nr:urease accessory protein UreD [Corallincola spongiicola]